MSLRGALAATLLGLAATAAQAWSQHAAMAYRAFEVMPEVARAAPVTAEPLEAFCAHSRRPLRKRWRRRRPGPAPT